MQLAPRFGSGLADCFLKSLPKTWQLGGGIGIELKRATTHHQGSQHRAVARFINTRENHGWKYTKGFENPSNL